ncbi:DUF6252 family protein [Hymenobacter sp. APR13]|uniref:DUF6252 family protein n=1 Tax=Hymenobacter sp. APR13 TaxID=1356852 RepID=UPI0004E07AF4|nr:DUF6252 family protein [Hymenobacter sp. APR13]AII51273.1 hypothetical protein N008_04660 [Hymenobacter sp. APR13]
MKPSLLILFIGILITACKKEEVDALPEATRTGQNTGGCLIDGKAFVAKGWPSGGLLGPRAIPPLTGGFAFDSVYYVELNGQHNGQNVSILLFLRKPVVGNHLLNQNTQYYPQGSPRYILDHATYSTSNNTGEVYVTDARHTGQVQLTYMNEPISAGTFEFTAASTFDRTRTVTITNGRFDRKQ